jgi:hypothetical protein
MTIVAHRKRDNNVTLNAQRLCLYGHGRERLIRYSIARFLRRFRLHGLLMAARNERNRSRNNYSFQYYVL